MSSPACFGSFSTLAPVCDSCHAQNACRQNSPVSVLHRPDVEETDGYEGEVAAGSVDLALTLYSGQTFRWGRDADGWWKGIAFGVVLHLKQDGEVIRYVTSRERVATYAGNLDIHQFLRWYLRLEEEPRIRVPRSDRYLRRARDRMRGFRFVRQEPWECVISYILSVQAHMVLTKQRIQFLSRILGREVRMRSERYFAFPEVSRLALLDEGYYRHQKFGWRSKFLPVSITRVARTITSDSAQAADLEEWRTIVDGLQELPNSGVGLKVAKCIDLFSLDRLSAVPVDTWVRKLAADWYGVEGSDAHICRWAEERGGKLAGYWNEYLFAYYRELNAPALDDRVISFAQSDAPSSFLPFDRDLESAS